MAKDLKVILTLDGKDYSATISKAVSETKKFEEQVDKTNRELDDMKSHGNSTLQAIAKYGEKIGLSKEQTLKFSKAAGKAAKVVGVIGAVIGAAVVAFETYGKVMHSNAITGELFDAAVDGATESLNDFFSALSRGDWSIYENGILRALALTLKAALEFKKMKRNMIIADAQLTEYDKNLNRYETIINDPNATKEQKEEAKRNFDAEYKKYLKTNTNILTENKNNLKYILAAKNVKVDESQFKEKFLTYMSTTTQEGRNLEKFIELSLKLYGKEWYDYLPDISPTGMVINAAKKKFKSSTVDHATKEMTLNQMKSLDPMLVQMAKARAAFGTEEKLQETVDLFMKQDSYSERMTQAERQKQGIEDKFDAEGNYIAKDEPKFSIPNFSQEQNSVAAEKLNLTPLEVPLKFVFGETSLNDLKSQQAALQKLLDNAPINQRVNYYSKIGYAKSTVEEAEKGHFIDINKGVSASDFQIKTDDNMFQTMSEQAKNFNLELQESVRLKKELAEGKRNLIAGQFFSAADALSSLSSAFATFGEESKEMAAFSKMMAMAAAIAGFIAQLQKCTTVWEYIAAAASGFAIISSAVMQLSNFANGGIIQGPTSMGDYNIARVNSGEMILNSSLQGRLFNMLNGAGAVGQQVAPVEREWRIEGSTLVGVLKNYNAVLTKLGKKIF